MAMAATGIDRNGDVDKLEFKSSPNVSMDESQEEHSQTLDSCDVDIPVPTMETSTEASSKASLHDEIRGESDYDFVKSVEIDENSIPSVIEEIYPVDGPCVQCEIEQPCSFRFTDNGQTLYVCNEPCIKAYQAENPGKYTVTRMKYIIEEITPETFLCSECEQNKTCYFYHIYDGEETYYCSLNCLHGMMADEKEKYTFKLNNVNICINQIRPKEGQCLICEKVKPCEFSMVRYGETCFLCERTCIKVLSVREHGRYYISKQRVNILAVTTALDKQLDEGYNIQAKAAAMAQREQSFHRRCSQCTLILMIDENVLTWEAMDFCDEICLEKFQKGIGSKCAKCESLVQRTSLGKYCVRFGYDIRQFCNSSCLEEFKKGLKICCYCQRDISASTQVFLAPVGDKGQLKDFCAQACVEKFDQMSRNPKPQPVWAKCAVCSLEKATAIEMEVSETDSQRLCSDTCFAAFTFAQNIVPDQCKCCKKYFERKPTQSFTTYEDDSNRNCFCSLSCMTIHIHHTRFLVSCNKCKSMKYNYDMIRRVDNDQAVMMCSLSCLNLYQESSTTGAPASTLATPIPSIEQGRADVITLAAEQLITLTQTRKRRKTTQSSKQEEPQIINLEKLSSVKTDSPPSGRKKEARSSRLAAEQVVTTLTKTRKRRATTQSSKQEEPQINKLEKFSSVITDLQPSGKKEAGSSRLIVRDIHELPEGSAMETALHPKRKRMWRPSIQAGPSRSVATPSPSMALTSPSPSLSVPSPAMFEECDSEARELPPSPASASPRPVAASPSPSTASPVQHPPPTHRHRRSLPVPSRERTISTHINHGSEEDSDDSDEEFVAVPGIPRMYQSLLETPLDGDEDAAGDPAPDSCPASADVPSTATDQPWSWYDFEWKEFPSSQVPPESRRETFSQINVGPATPHDDPYDIFIGIWDRQIMEHIVSETNKYAQQVADWMFESNSLHPSSRIVRWHDTTTDELYVYYGIVLAMGVVVKTRLEEYWSSTPDIFYTPGFSAHMSIDRFIMINKCLHFNDNDDMCALEMGTSEAKLFKIKPIVSHLNMKFQQLYTPARNIALDESLLMWKGWLEMSQLIPNKSAKKGIKTYEICESQTGYLWRFEIHAQKKTPPQHNDDPLAASTPSIVLRLIQGLENKGYTLWMDNFYNSPCLARRLKCLGFDCVGTLRTDREFVPQALHSLTKRNMRPGQIAGLTSGDVDVMVWRDTNRVSMISTYHGNHQQTVRGSTKPTLILDYNIMMGGVDKKDQLLAMYPVERKRSKVWYKKLFKRLLNISVLNSYIIHRHSSTITHRNFRISLIKSLLSKHSARPAPPPAPTQKALQRSDISHRVAEYSMAPGGHQRLRRTCKVCKKKTRTFCVGCNKTVCLDPCFQTLHT